MPRDADALLRAARDELYHLRVVANGLRNRIKLDAAAIADSERRVEGLLAEIEARLNGSPRPKEAQGNDEEHEGSTQHLAEAR